MNKIYNQLWKGVTDKTDKPEAAQALVEMVANNAGRDFILGLEREEAELCIEILDHGIVNLNLKPAEKSTFLVTLRRLAEHHKLLPHRVKMTGEIVISEGKHPFGRLTEFPMYRGQHVATTTSQVIAVEDFPGQKLTDSRRDRKLELIQNIKKRFYRELVLWSTLSHPNVLKLLAVSEDAEKTLFTTVSEWMDWTIMDYTEVYYVNRLDLLHEAAQGLEYLHGIGLAHGNLRGDNVLVSNNEPLRACLADFSFTTTILDTGQESLCSARSSSGIVRFMSPELLAPDMYGMEDARASQEADVYAFGLVIFQVLTGGIPFADIMSWALGYWVPEGERPAKPENASTLGFSDSLWGFTERCWSGEIESRPKVGEVVTHLREAAAERDEPMPPTLLSRSPPPSDDDDIFDKRYLPITT